MRHRRPRKGKRVLRCPMCQSDRLVYEGALIMGQVYHCLACDYVGSFVLETDEVEAPGATPPGPAASSRLPDGE